MKSIQLLVLATFVGTALSDLALDFDENTTIVDVVSSIEDCSWPCWDKAVAASGCGSTDFECFCKDRGVSFVDGEPGNCVYKACGSTVYWASSIGYVCTTLELNKPSEDDLSKARELVNDKMAASGKVGSDEKPKKDDQGEKKDGESSGVRVVANMALAVAAGGAHLLV